ncbi:hypothetical protein cyc_01502 [Cyclospora cayetanensis]|uniref:Uncharacterized protein n=1 Tax=Cyclospora cayetanensis TaxID=88456 RepID=A0A1D3D6X0_9EIME|nr:hypothetical protein cyc_01502 [Cyclospora cayetanensis]
MRLAARGSQRRYSHGIDSSNTAFLLHMASSKPRSRAPGTHQLQRVRQQQYELRVALQQKNRCLYTPLPQQQPQRLFEQRFPLSLQQMRVPLRKQKKRGRWLLEKRTKLAWRRVQHHVQQLPDLLQQQRAMLVSPEQEQELNAAAQKHDRKIRDAVWRSFIATRVIPRLALLARQQEQPARDHQTQDAQQRSLQHEAALRDYLAMASPVRGTRLAADVHAFAQLLQMEPPPVSKDAQGLVATLQELHSENFTRFLARAYKFSKGWALSGRFFLLALTRRQQLLPRRPSAAAWDADTDNFEVAIDSLALLWRRSAFPEAQEHQHLHHQQVFLEELDGADVHYRQALAEPLLRAIHEKAGPILGVRPYR